MNLIFTDAKLCLYNNSKNRATRFWGIWTLWSWKWSLIYSSSFRCNWNVWVKSKSLIDKLILWNILFYIVEIKINRKLRSFSFLFLCIIINFPCKFWPWTSHPSHGICDLTSRRNATSSGERCLWNWQVELDLVSCTGQRFKDQEAKLFNVIHFWVVWSCFAKCYIDPVLKVLEDIDVMCLHSSHDISGSNDV